MSLSQRIVAVCVAGTLGLAIAAPAFAQQQQPRHVVDQSALQTAVADKVAHDAADRALVLKAFHQPRVEAMASNLGLTPSRVDAAVATMSPSELHSAVAPAALAASAEAGGDVVVLSVTTLLLILILVVLIAK
jgi:hypothetical protein